MGHLLHFDGVKVPPYYSTGVLFKGDRARPALAAKLRLGGTPYDLRLPGHLSRSGRRPWCSPQKRFVGRFWSPGGLVPGRPGKEKSGRNLDYAMGFVYKPCLGEHTPQGGVKKAQRFGTMTLRLSCV